ncbi:DUF4270 family protein [Larkinella insperata]|uniref:DUF4270 family protein n=1 Tax=Larkinella insperata TaxID=332158 RepID=A0ABW3QLW4_9BACT|nr:DUF4270 family protein [Larkinella insperata]
MLTNITTFTRNWRANQNPVRLSILAGLVSLVVGLVACEEPKDIGLPPVTAIGVLYTDTLTVQTSTVQLDSVVTSRNERQLVGQYNDPVFGKVTAKTFGQLQVQGGTFKTEGEVIYDSLRAGVGYDLSSYLYGDTTKVQELFFHRLTEDMDSTRQYVSSESIAYTAQPLGKMDVKPTAVGTASVIKTARLSDALGRELLEKSKGAGFTQADFQQFFKGIALVPGANNTTVFGFSPQYVQLQLFYHKSGDTVSTGKVFYTTTARQLFSQIKVDRSATKLAGLSVTKPLPSSATDGEVFFQSATGLTTKVQFPTLENLKKETGRVAINRAELQFFVKGSSPGGPVPSLLTLAQTDNNNRILRTNEASTGSQLFHLLQVRERTFQTVARWYYPQVKAYNSRLKNYAFDVTTHLQASLVGFQPNNALVLMPTSAGEGQLVAQSNTTGALVYQVQPFIYNQLNGAILGGPLTAKLVVFYTYTP